MTKPRSGSRRSQLLIIFGVSDGNYPRKSLKTTNIMTTSGWGAVRSSLERTETSSEDRWSGRPPPAPAGKLAQSAPTALVFSGLKPCLRQRE